MFSNFQQLSTKGKQQTKLNYTLRLTFFKTELNLLQPDINGKNLYPPLINLGQ